MGRIFEVRKAKKFARYDRMAKQFTRLGREIAIAVKQGGGDPETNPLLRRCFQNAKSVNMPKDRVETAIKNALGKDQENYEEVLYEGYASHGVAVLVETATDNPTRTVANVRSYFNKAKGSLGTSGSVSFMFNKMGAFKIKRQEGMDMGSIELSLIDYGLQEMGENDENELVFRSSFVEFGLLQKGLESLYSNFSFLSGIEWIPTTMVDLKEPESEEVLRLIARIEEDEDVKEVFHNLR